MVCPIRLLSLTFITSTYSYPPTHLPTYQIYLARWYARPAWPIQVLHFTAKATADETRQKQGRETWTHQLASRQYGEDPGVEGSGYWVFAKAQEHCK